MRTRRAQFAAGLFAAGLLAVVAGVPAGADDKPAPPTARERMLAANTLKQIGLAFHIAHDKFGHLPVDITSKDGKGLLSWRVAILPYIEQEPLYKEFKLDESWDSDHNKKLVAKMPKLYAPIRGKANVGETFYQVFTGEKAIFAPGRKPRFVAITDGTSNTGMVFEAGEPVVWTKPADLSYDEKKPLPKLGGMFDGEFNVAMCDGSVHRIKKDPDEKELRKLIMPADGEPIDFKKLEK
jgi:prepilin-type processing-associated H-X9-DG protein